jgi:hypothetical protein
MLNFSSILENFPQKYKNSFTLEYFQFAKTSSLHKTTYPKNPAFSFEKKYIFAALKKNNN